MVTTMILAFLGRFLPGLTLRRLPRPRYISTLYGGAAGRLTFLCSSCVYRSRDVFYDKHRGI